MGFLRFANAAVVAAALTAAAAASAQTAGDPARGKALYNDTPGESGIANLTASCANCHTAVEERRARISLQLTGATQDFFADITPAQAAGRLSFGMNNVPDMRQFLALSGQQLDDIAAYLADTPKTSTKKLDFNVANAGSVSAQQNVDLAAAKVQTNVPAAEQLTVTAVSLQGANAADFRINADGCNLQTLPLAATCRVTLSFQPAATGTKTAQLKFDLRSSSSTSRMFMRLVDLNGTVGSSVNPNPPPSDDGGGGALGVPWLLALLAAIVAAARLTRRRR
jgi:cytochrome c553